jgi:hypothetical protein
MELYKAEAEQLKKQISNWIEHPDYELESTFGKGTVDATTFFQVALRLRSKGLTELSQEDRLTITTPLHVRFTVQSMGVIQQYCRDNTLSGKPFVAMIKDRSSVDSNIDLDDYDVRIKTRREILMANDEVRIKELFAKWPIQKKAFRMIRRWSFEESGLRYDLSIVRSTKRDSNGEFKWQRNFLDQDLSTHPYLYEIEVELLRLDGDTIESAQKRLVKGVGEILRGIQKNSILIRKSKKDLVIQSYQNFIQSNRFLGCSPVTLEQRNFSDTIDPDIPNIRTGYNITDKADGLRCLAYTNSKGELYLIDMSLNVYRTGLEQKYCRESIIDGEWVTKTRNKEPMNQFLAFDIYYTTDKKDVSQLQFHKEEENSRYKELKLWVETFNKGDGPTKLLPYLNSQNILQISIKSFLFAKPDNMSIFKNASKVLDTYKIYYTDGLIFTPNSLPLPGYDENKKTIKPSATFFQQFKWKPSEDNTVDFLVRFEKLPDNPNIDRVTIGIKPETNQTVRYKTLRLFVGSSRTKGFNPRDTILNERKHVEEQGNPREYRPVPFYPKQFYDSMASVSYNEVKLDPSTQEEYVATEINNEPIQDKSIIEMRYDASMPRGWRWIPIRIRHDKTERLQKGTLARTLNSEDVAESIWNSIHEPITLSMIRSGSTQPNETEINGTLRKIEERDNVAMKYFERKAPAEDLMFVTGLREFHNQYIKEIVLYNSCLRGGNKKLVDIACGKGSDIRRWVNNKVSFVLGIDYAGDNITNTEDGAYARYINFSERNRKIQVPTMVFTIGDSSKRIIDGRAGSTDEERDIMRSVFGKYAAIGPIPSYVDHNAAGELKNGADAMSCMFALHYFFENKEKLDGLLRNIREGLKLGGYFFGCCFDGDSIFNFLKDTSTGGTLTGTEKDAILWNIRKDYSADELTLDEDSLNLKINVDFISIGSSHDEYLVSFPYFTELMRENGLELLSEVELKEIGLKHSTNLFSESYEMSKKIGKKYSMSDAVKKFSFLNRWFIFRKKKEVVLKEEVDEKDFVPIVNNSRKNKETKTVVIAEAAPINSEESVAVNPSAVEKEDNVMPVINSITDVVPPEEKSEEALVNAVQKEKNAISNIGTVQRTVPVEKGTAAPVDKLYSSNEVLNFYIDAALDDKKLKIGDKGAARWLAPCAPFPIEDPEDSTIEYPTIEHFMAAMMYEYGSTNPAIAQSVFSRTGTIHQSYVRRRLQESEGQKKALTEDRDFQLIKEESAEVKSNTSAGAFKKYKTVFNESKYAVKKDELLEYAVSYRFKKDVRLRKILEAARTNNKYLLYYTHGTSNNLGGMRKTDGTIVGDNKLGKLYMKLAGYSEY